MVAAVSANSAPSSGNRFSIVQGQKRQKPPPRLVLYGEPKIGKTTFGASAPDVVFIPTEDGSLGLDVARIPNEGKCESFADVITALTVLLKEQHSFKWVVIDTLNEAQHLCAQMVCERDFGGKWNTSKGVEGFNAFSKGEKATAQEMRALLSLLDQLQQKRGIGIILLAHVGLHKQGNALGADFQKFGGDMDKNTWALVCGWADQIGHACRDLRASTREGESKAKASAIGSERWVVFDGGPGRDAGARAGYEMPERILLSWEEYEKASKADRSAQLVEQAFELVNKVPEKIAASVKQKLGGEVTQEALAALTKTQLETLIGWLLAWSKKGE
jgi:hypothetical protein